MPIIEKGAAGPCAVTAFKEGVSNSRTTALLPLGYSSSQAHSAGWLLHFSQGSHSHSVCLFPQSEQRWQEQ